VVLGLSCCKGALYLGGMLLNFLARLNFFGAVHKLDLARRGFCPLHRTPLCTTMSSSVNSLAQSVPHCRAYTIAKFCICSLYPGELIQVLQT
jgi:hypothetical protein